MRPEATNRLPSNEKGWAYERKLDGQRVFGYHDGDTAHLTAQNHRSLNTTYPELVEALEAQTDHTLVVDGEVVVIENGRTSFEKLQDRMHRAHPPEDERTPVAWVLFDLLHLDGWDTRNLPFLTRKKLLKDAIDAKAPLAVLSHIHEHGQILLDQGQQKGWEGIMAKRATAPYAQDRSDGWLKIKIRKEQEFVVGGYTRPEGSPVPFDEILLGYYDKHVLTYAGRVNTGFSHGMMEGLGRILPRLEQDEKPFHAGDPPRHARWVKPRMVIQAAFTEWTPNNRIRHARFKGLRPDKDPTTITKDPLPNT